MTLHIQRQVLEVTLAMLLCSCATPERFAAEVSGKADKMSRSAITEKEPPATIRADQGIHIAATPVEYLPPGRGMVTMRVSDIPLSSAIGGIAEGAGYSVSYQAGADPLRPISLDLRDVDPQSAIREMAYAAGLVAVFDRPKSVTIAREATLTFRVPKRLLSTMQARYSVTNTQSGLSGSAPGSSGGGASSPSPSGASGNSSNTSSISISGSANQDVAVLRAFLQGMTGADANILQEEGIISARGNAMQLRRLQSFLDQFVRDSLAQVEVELSVVEVLLNSEFQTGIDWTRIIPQDTILGSALGSISLRAGPDFPTDAFSIRTTSRSIDSIVRALEQFTSVTEVTRPRIVALNHAHSVYRAPMSRPFLTSATSNVIPGGGGNTIQSSGALSYTEEGVSFVVQAHVIDAHRVELLLVPLVAATTNIATFALSREITLSGASQARQESYLQVLAEHGKTMVLGGLRTSSGTDRVSGIPGAVRVPGLNLLLGGHNDRNTAREVVMLLHTRIVPAGRVSTLIGESV